MKNHAKSRTVTVSCVVAALVVVSAAALLLLRRRGEPALPRPMAQPVPGKVAVKPKSPLRRYMLLRKGKDILA